MRSELIRQYFPVSYKLPEGLVFKIAQTKEELEAAFTLVHDEFVATGYIAENPARLRLTKYHALPGTSVLIGKWQDEVVCTLSVIHDNPMGLPSEVTWDISSLRESSSRVAEISGLAIKRSLQGRRGTLLMPLCKFMYEYAYNYAGVEVIVVATQDIVREFYRSILLFKPVGDGKPVPHGPVKNRLSYAQFLDFRSCPADYARIYSHRSNQFNLDRYFTKVGFEQFQFPEKVHGQCVFPVMSRELLDYFFNKKIPLFAELSDVDQLAIRAAYSSYERVESLIGDQGAPELARREPRVAVACEATVIDRETKAIQLAKAVAVSRSGLTLKLSKAIPVNHFVIIHLDLGPLGVVRLEARVVWCDGQLRSGVKISDVSSCAWYEFVKGISSSSAKADRCS